MTFWWGTAASSTQAEGSAPGTDWRRWEDEGRVPASGDGNGFGHRYAEDFALLASLGLDHHRLSLDWARIEPAPGRVDGQAIEHYAAILEAARQAGIKVWVCLHHFVLPGWFVDEGGFADDRARYFWARHVDRVAERFGADVFGWKPINEPSAYAACGFLDGIHPPGVRDPKAFAQALRGAWLAYRDAWRLLRGGPPVATVLNLSPVHADDDSVPARRWARLHDEILWGVGVRALRDGVLEVPGLVAEEVPDLRNAADIVGFSYYSAVGVDREGRTVPFPKDRRVGPMGYAPWSEGLGLTVRRLAEELPDRPLLVAEHGVGTTDDGWRAEVLSESLAVVDEARADGIDLRGFFHWTAVDNYEWIHGFGIPFGIIERDRTPKPSASVLSAAARRDAQNS